MKSNPRAQVSRPPVSAKWVSSPARISRRAAVGLMAAILVLSLAAIPALAQQGRPGRIAPVPKPAQRDHAVHANLALVSDLINDFPARRDFKVDGKGLAVAVLDTGLRTTHVDFAGAGRIPAQQNFTTDNGGDVNNVTDGNGHGTNVAGIIVAHDEHTGIAPGANIIPIKVLTDDGGGDFDAIDKALQWVIDHHDQFKIGVVNMSLGDVSNRTSDDDLAADSIRLKIKALRAANVAVVVAAGNDWFKFNDSSDSARPLQQGMGYPAIIRETVSVGAVYDSDIGPVAYVSGAEAFTTAADRITPFSQRLSLNVNADCKTDIFAPGAPVTSSGNGNDHGESVESGTSQASPVTAGCILLMQQFYMQAKGKLPSVDDLETWLRLGAVTHEDGNGEDDNVKHTHNKFPRVDARNSLLALKRQLSIETLQEQGQLRRPSPRSRSNR
jgi:subtilisin family serine protease